MTTNDERESRPRAPKPTVATEPERNDVASRAEDAPADAGAAPSESHGAVSGAGAESSDGGRATGQDRGAGIARGIGDWLVATFPGHVNAVVFGFVGFALALLLFMIGLWQTILIALLVACGVAFGQYLDGDPRIIRFVGRLFDNGTHKRKR